MSGKVSDIVRLFQIPNFDHTLVCPNAEDDAIGMELSTGQP